MQLWFCWVDVNVRMSEQDIVRMSFGYEYRTTPGRLQICHVSLVPFISGYMFAIAP